MRKLLLISSLLFVHASFAQLQKKTWLLGGDASFEKSSHKYDSNMPLAKSSTVDVSLNTGYFFWNKLALGLRGSLNNSVSRYPPYSLGPGGEQRLRSTVWGVGPFVRYYFLPQAKPFNLFADAGGAYNLYSNNSNNLIDKSLSVAGAAGMALFFNQSIALEFSLAYKHSAIVGVENKSDYLQFKVGFQLHFSKDHKGD